MLLNPVIHDKYVVVPADASNIFLEKYNPDRDQIRKIAFACLMVLNATFNNVSVISLRSVLLVEETGGPGENHRPVASR